MRYCNSGSDILFNIWTKEDKVKGESEEVEEESEEVEEESEEVEGESEEVEGESGIERESGNAPHYIKLFLNVQTSESIWRKSSTDDTRWRGSERISEAKRTI